MARAVRGSILLLAGVALILGLAAVGQPWVTALLSVPPSATTAPAKVFASSGITFEYPASWQVYEQMPLEIGGGQTIAVLGTLPWGECAVTDLNCHIAQSLGPGQVEVTVTTVGSYDICEFATRPIPSGLASAVVRVLLRLHGRPTVRLGPSPMPTGDALTEGSWAWVVAYRGTTGQSVVIDARLRGPNVDALTAAVDHVLATLAVPELLGLTGPVDCGSPFPS
jgi:hypothetical protein